MTRKEVVNFIKRFPFIIKAVKKNLPSAVFVIGNRKKVIEITPEVRELCKIVEMICEEERDANIKLMIQLILNGESNIYIMQRVHYCKNAFYERKSAFIDKVFNCCILRGLVSLDEILGRDIA